MTFTATFVFKVIFYLQPFSHKTDADFCTFTLYFYRLFLLSIIVGLKAKIWDWVKSSKLRNATRSVSHLSKRARGGSLPIFSVPLPRYIGWKITDFSRHPNGAELYSHPLTGNLPRSPLPYSYLDRVLTTVVNVFSPRESVAHFLHIMRKDY